MYYLTTSTDWHTCEAEQAAGCAALKAATELVGSRGWTLSSQNLGSYEVGIPGQGVLYNQGGGHVVMLQAQHAFAIEIHFEFLSIFE